MRPSLDRPAPPRAGRRPCVCGCLAAGSSHSLLDGALAVLAQQARRRFQLAWGWHGHARGLRHRARADGRRTHPHRQRSSVHRDNPSAANIVREKLAAAGSAVDAQPALVISWHRAEPGERDGSAGLAIWRDGRAQAVRPTERIGREGAEERRVRELNRSLDDSVAEGHAVVDHAPPAVVHVREAKN